MPPYTLLFLFLVLAICAFGYIMRYRTGAEKRAREKKRNQYNDRI